MLILTSKNEISKKIYSLKEKRLKIGFVPTMGALHQGHLSLLNQAKKKNDIVICSIFINPTQFDNSNDLKNYPKTIESDIEKLKTIQTDILFAPSINEMYKQNTQAEQFNLGQLETIMEGKFRKGHFQGVATIVKKLFNIVQPHNAYFGEKDFQQLAIIKKMTQEENFDINIIGVPTHREKDGLAMSSRNTLLTRTHRQKAPLIYEVLSNLEKYISQKKELREVHNWVNDKFNIEKDLELEYFEITNEELQTVSKLNKNQKLRAFIAVLAGEVRLIDNIAINT